MAGERREAERKGRRERKSKRIGDWQIGVRGEMLKGKAVK